ncbi:TPA: hypothetical protein ACNROZ_000899 [Escherichia coli]|nr:hypothetical protein [Escherichia coli]MDV1287051.1 hypothetical protein [Escherichia coli]MDV1697007.1 hypothetical protein [Escherichia coli]
MSNPEPVLTRRKLSNGIKTGIVSLFRDKYTGVFRMLSVWCPA